jgi:hypothetical protein
MTASETTVVELRVTLTLRYREAEALLQRRGARACIGRRCAGRESNGQRLLRHSGGRASRWGGLRETRITSSLCFTRATVSADRESAAAE